LGRAVFCLALHARASRRNGWRRCRPLSGWEQDMAVENQVVAAVVAVAGVVAGAVAAAAAAVAGC
jgi:hypothetical protein